MMLRVTDRRERMLFFTAVAVAAAIALFPISTRATRLIAVLLAVLLPLLAFRLLRRHRVLSGLVLLPLLVGLVALLAPGRSYSASNLTSRYIAALRSYVGTRYVWGGETAIATHFSALVRQRLFNPPSFRALQTP